MDVITRIAQPVLALGILALIARLPEKFPGETPFFSRHQWTLGDGAVILIAVFTVLWLGDILLVAYGFIPSLPIAIMFANCLTVLGLHHFLIQRRHAGSLKLLGIDKAKFLGSGVLTLNIVVTYFWISAASTKLPQLNLAAPSSEISFWAIAVFFGFGYPVCEELLFRGILYAPVARRIGKWNTIITLSFVFCLMHSCGLWEFAFLFLISVLLYYAYIWTESLAVPILLHIALNIGLWQPLSMAILAQYVSATTLTTLYVYAPLCTLLVIDSWWLVTAFRGPTSRSAVHSGVLEED